MHGARITKCIVSVTNGYIESDLLQTINFDDIVEKFITIKSRKVKF